MAEAPDRQDPALPRQSLVIVPLFAVIAAIAVALRIVERGDIWLDRTWWLVGLAAFAGLIGAASVRLAQRWITWPVARNYPRLAATTVFAGSFMAAMMVAYVLHYLVIGGQIEEREGRPVWAWLWIASDVAALFLISSPAYLLPWPLPVMMAAAGWLLPAAPREEPGKNVQAG